MTKTLGNLLRSTLEQVGAVSEVALSRARESRDRFDDALSERKRRAALARLGEAVYVLWQRDGIGKVADIPEIARMLADIEEHDQEYDDGYDDYDDGYDDGYDGDGDREPVSSADWRPPSPTNATGTRQRMHVWRPVMPPDDDSRDEANATTLASPSLSKPVSDLHDLVARVSEAVESVSATSTPSVEPRVTPDPAPDLAPDPAPDVDTASEVTTNDASMATRPPETRVRRGRRRRGRSTGDEPATRGGIAFVTDPIGDPDEDLAEYMHDEDVPSDG